MKGLSNKMPNKKRKNQQQKNSLLNLFFTHIPLNFSNNREESLTCYVVSHYFQQYFGSNFHTEALSKTLRFYEKDDQVQTFQNLFISAQLYH